ncbi:DUF1353 domain-containing protein [Sagittula sp.]|uniref:DUF1353 domain-containing protein n=1 Tax=Sagittula sp. TaxID=2038081 RepID=UPI003511944E
MPRLRRLFLALATVAAIGIAGAVIGLPEIIARRAAQVAQTCLDLADRETRCRFIGGPLEMQGQPVFMEGFNQAFLPTRDEIEFIDASGETWTAPRQTLTDGATIPPIFAPLIGDRQSREYLMAAALHDAYCGVGNNALPTWRTRAWQDVHRMFYEALLVNGTPPQKAKIMFAAVYLGGPRWDDPARDLSEVPEEALQKEMAWCLEWIEQTDPDVEAIAAWMTKREADLKAGKQVRPAVLGAPAGE